MKSNSMKVKNIIKRQLVEASPVSFKEFPEDKKKIVNAIAKEFNATIQTKNAYEGIHGYIIDLKSNYQYGHRIDAQQLKFLASSKIRWIELGDDNTFTIGL